MINKTALLFFLFALLLYPPKTDASNFFTKKERVAVMELVERERTLLNAKVKSDWKTIYSLLTPKIRSLLTLNEYIFQPHLPDGTVVVRPDLMPSEEELFKRLYQPTHIAYNITSVHLTKDRTFAKVVSDVTIPLPPNIGPITMNAVQEEYWSKIDGQWYLEWDLRYLVHMSGARERAKKLIPPFEYDIDLAKLAGWYLEKIKEFPEQKELLIRKALTLSPYFSALEISNKNIADKKIALEDMRYALQGREKHKGWFSSSMEAGRWYGVVGDYSSAYRHYKIASQLDRYRTDAIEGLVVSSILMNKQNDAATHLEKLLQLSSVLSANYTATVELLIGDDCRLCKEIDKEKLLKLARRLVWSQNWNQAFRTYKYILRLNKNYDDVAERIVKGKKVKLPKVFDGDLYKELSSFTLWEIGKVLESGGYGLYHQGDLPANQKIQLTLESKPKLFQASYDRGYMTDFLLAYGNIYWGQTISETSEDKAGYLALFIGDSVAHGRYYQDSHPMEAGSEALVKEINNLSKWDVVYLTRISTKPSLLTNNFKKALTGGGFKSKFFNKPLSSHMMVLNKKSSTLRIWEGREKIMKRFLPSNVKSLHKKDKASFVIKGSKGRESLQFLR